jgi:hypothetical protein
LLQSPDGYGGDVGLTISEFEGAANDACLDSIALSYSNDETILVSTYPSTPDVIPLCSYAPPNAPGTWYQIEGQGKAITVSSCSPLTSIATSISLFRGSCEDPLCVSEGIADSKCQGTVASRASFLAEQGTTYFILLQSPDGYGGDVGLTISEFEVAENDACLGRIGLSVSNDETILLSTAESAPDVIPLCSYALLNVPGTWYQIEGKGKAISLSSCSPLTNVATSISVFRGSCEDLLCVTEGIPDCNCQGTVASRAIFLAEEGNTYYILLQSPDGYGGDVGLTISEFEGAENDFCQHAFNMVVDSGEVGVTTVGAIGGSYSNDCFLDPTIPDVWYSVNGTGDILPTTACSNEFTFVSMSILQGNCTDNKCIATATSDTEACAIARFQSVIGETYHIILQALSESGVDVFFHIGEHFLCRRAR